MHPVVFQIFGKDIYSYGILTALGLLAAILTWMLLGRHDQRLRGFAADLGLWLMLSGIIGARIAYVAANWDHYRAHPLEIVRIDQGGLIFYGGFLLAALALIMIARWKRMPVWYLADYVAPGLAIGHMFGRLGCFFNGCCYGRPAGESFWGIVYPPICEPGWLYPRIPLYPVQLFEAGTLFLIWGFLIWAYPRRSRDGSILAWYLLLYPPVRFLLEYLRGDLRQRWGVFDVAQVTSLALFATGAALLVMLPARRFNSAGPQAAPNAANASNQKNFNG